jgi:Zn-dependent protease
VSNLGLLSLLTTDPLVFVLLAVSLIGAIALHEYAHALAADLQGDRLPRAMGRLTLNPMKHLDPLGTLFIFLVGFGWGKPVEFRRQALSSQRFGAALVALAGPLMNLSLAFGAAVILGIVGRSSPAAQLGVGLAGQVLLFLEIFIAINVLLAVFNLLPLPPLDGSRLLTIFLPAGKQHVIFWLDRYGFFILIALLLLGGFSLLSPVIDAVGSFVVRIAGAG